MPDTLREALDDLDPVHPHDGKARPDCLCPCCINARTLAAIVANAAPYTAAVRGGAYEAPEPARSDSAQLDWRDSPERKR